jgi:hypothetical protein
MHLLQYSKTSCEWLCLYQSVHSTHKDKRTEVVHTTCRFPFRLNVTYTCRTLLGDVHIVFGEYRWGWQWWWWRCVGSSERAGLLLP